VEGGRIAIVREPEIRVNERIRAREVRVIAADGKQIGVLPVREAIKMAEEQGFDLVEVAPNATPPVCRFMDYGKYKYELKKQAVGKKQRVQLLKEVNFRPNIGEHDLDVKINRIREFLDEGHKAKVRISFRGREITHPELGRGLAERIIERIMDIGLIDSSPKFEGKNLITIIVPKKK